MKDVLQTIFGLLGVMKNDNSVNMKNILKKERGGS